MELLKNPKYCAHAPSPTSSFTQETDAAEATGRAELVRSSAEPRGEKDRESGLKLRFCLGREALSFEFLEVPIYSNTCIRAITIFVVALFVIIHADVYRPAGYEIVSRTYHHKYFSYL